MSAAMRVPSRMVKYRLVYWLLVKQRKAARGGRYWVRGGKASGCQSLSSMAPRGDDGVLLDVLLAAT